MYPTSKMPVLLLASLSTLLLFEPVHAAAFFSAGMITPETISQAPAGFGAHAGS